MNPTLHLTFAPTTAWLRLEGELDETCRAHLARRVLDLEEFGCSLLHLDVSEVTRVEPDCLPLIQDMWTAMAVRGAGFHVSGSTMTFTLSSAARS